MNLAEFSFKRKTTVYVMTVVFLLGGIVSFQDLGRLEDPEFTIKQAVVMTRYPGATAYEVEQEVTEVLEEAIMAMGQRYRIRSLSKPGTLDYLRRDAGQVRQGDPAPGLG